MQRKGSKITLRRSSAAAMSVSPTKDQLMAVGPRRNSVVGALSPVDDQLHVGYVVKCGGSVRSWKRRWMVLGADGVIYYFPKPGAKAKGSLQLAYDDSAHAVRNSERSDFMFAVNTAKRTFLMYPDSEEERSAWLDAITKAICDVAKKEGKAMAPEQSHSLASSTSTPGRRLSSSSDGDGLEQGISLASRNILKDKVMALAFDSLSVRQIIQNSLLHLDWLPLRPMLKEFHRLWMHNLPYAHNNESEEESAEIVFHSFGCAVDDSVALWSTSAHHSVMVQGIVDFLYSCGVDSVEEKMFSALCEIARPETVGLWLEGHEDGSVLGGWSLTLPADCNQQELIRKIGHKKLGEFYEANKVRLKVVHVARNCSDVGKCFILTLSAQSNHLEMLYGMLESFMPLPLTIVKNIRLLGKNVEGDFLKLHVSDDGSFGAVEIVLPGSCNGKSINHLKRLLGSPPSHSGLRVTQSGGSVQLVRWDECSSLIESSRK